jgi:[ribosomal protein S5]-alanine N-acetyltransferase
MRMNLVSLRAFEPEDLSLLHEWHNDGGINKWTGGVQRFVSSEYDKKWLEDKMLNNTNQVYCAIYDCVTKETIGYISLNDINYINRTAFWGGVVISPDHRNKGVATQAAFQMLEYGFFELGLQKISGKWLVGNTTSIFMAKALGFVQEGRLRREVFKGNEYHDTILMSILKEEFIIKAEE